VRPPLIDDDDGPERSPADRIATRNVPVVRPMVDYGLPMQPIDTAPTSEPAFERPELETMAPATTAMLIGRGLMVVAMVLVGIAARRSTGSFRTERAEAFWPVVASAGVFVVVGFAGLVFWSVSLADNAQRLTVRAASSRRMGWSWAPVVAWVVLSAVTYLRVEYESELDPLPGIAGLGFAVSLAIPYARLQGIFRALLRRPPVVWIAAFPLDLLAFGLVWWRLTSWPEPVSAADVDHVRLTAAVAFGAAALLVVNAFVFARLAQRGVAGLYERLGRLEARHRAAEPSPPEWPAERP